MLFYTKICYGNRTLLISLGKVLKSTGIIYKAMGPVVQRPVSASPGLNFNAGLYISFFQSLLEKISLFFFRTSNDQIASKKIWTEFSLKLSDLKSNSMLTLGYLNPDLNNSGHVSAYLLQLYVPCTIVLFIPTYFIALRHGAPLIHPPWNVLSYSRKRWYESYQEVFFNAHTEPIFKQSKILNLYSIYRFKIGKIMFFFQDTPSS